MLTRVLCATDRSGSAAKLYRHAAGIASIAGASLGLVHVGAPAATDPALQHLLEEYLATIPYGGDYPLEPEVYIRDGDPGSALLACGREFGADLIIAGSRRRGAVAAWLLGSTSRALLEDTRTPLLLIPDNDLDVVTVDLGHARLNFGCVIAALDLAESNPGQLRVASEMARLARQPLSLMTVLEPGGGVSHAEASAQLRDRAHGLELVRPRALIVRRGDIAEEIVRCATAEESGLVVMGLRSRGRGARPGAIAAAVLNHGRAAVLAVPNPD